jgi:uncharacterized protein (TIGR00369 family)
MSSVAESFAAVPVNTFLGFSLDHYDEQSARVLFRPQSAHTQEYRVVHGGIIAALADTAAVYTVHPFLGPGERMTSIEFKINFLAGATSDRGQIVARAHVIRKGKSVAVAQVDITQGDTVVATGLFTYLILRS